MKKLLFVMILLATLSGVTVNAQTNKSNEQISLFEYSLVGPSHEQNFTGWLIKDRMAHYKVNGVSIAVIRNYKIEWVRAYGFADVANKTPVTTATRFQAGSISKSLNAIGVLKIAEKEGINLDSDINSYLRSWKVNYSKVANGHTINIRELLSHSAGFNVSGFSGYKADQPIPSTVQILEGKSPANSPAVHLISQPGLKYEYSGGGTTITQLLIEDITHEHYDDYLQSSVLNPLGMLNSSFKTPDKESD